MDEADDLENRAASQRRNAQTCGVASARGKWYLESAVRLEREAWAIRQRNKPPIVDAPTSTTATVDAEPPRLRVPGADTKRAIRMIRSGKSNEDIAEATTKTADAIRRLRSDYDAGKFDLSWLKT